MPPFAEDRNEVGRTVEDRLLHEVRARRTASGVGPVTARALLGEEPGTFFDEVRDRQEVVRERLTLHARLGLADGGPARARRGRWCRS